MSAVETGPNRIKRLRMRSWRRGTKEMDMVLGPFADARLDAMDEAALARYDLLLEENDQDLYRWVSGQEPAPAAHRELIEIIRDNALNR